MKLVVNEIGLYPGLKFYEALPFMVRHFYFIVSVLGSHWRILTGKWQTVVCTLTTVQAAVWTLDQGREQKQDHQSRREMTEA